MKYLEPSTSSSSPSTLNDVLPCDDINPSFSYSRFLLILKNDTIINIGLECSEVDITCFNTYFTIYSVSPYPFRYKLSKRKIEILPSRVKFSDAILSLDEKTIYLLLNY